MMNRLAAGHRFGPENVRRHVPGILLFIIITASACGLRQVALFGWLSPMILAIVMGAAFHNLFGVPDAARPGIEPASSSWWPSVGCSVLRRGSAF